MTRKSRRLILIAACGSVLALAVGLILFAMSGSIVFFRSPTDIAQQGIAPGTKNALSAFVRLRDVAIEWFEREILDCLAWLARTEQL